MNKPYDPFRDAEDKGIPVQWVDLPGTIFGLWTGTEILLDKSLTAIQARCTLAHELVHAEKDQPVLHESYAVRVEARADREAALKLIDPAAYERAVRCYPYENQVAGELGVTRKILRAFQQTLDEIGEDFASAA